MESRPVTPAMVGRTTELAELCEALKQVATGSASTVVVGGEAGIGKTRLVEEFSRRATAEGALVLTGHCVELGPDGLPYAPIAGALRALVAEWGAEAVAEQAGPGRDVLTGLLPDLAGPVEPAAPSTAAAPTAAGSERTAGPGPAPLGGIRTAAAAGRSGRGRLFEVVAVLLEQAATRHPLVLVVEDLHWADTSTRDLLGFLIRALGPVPVLLLVTYRSDELHRGHPLRPFLAELDRLRTVYRLQLGRLSREQVGEQLAAILDGRPPPTMVARVHERSEGIPFFVEELVDLERSPEPAPLPDTLRDLLLAKVEQLPDGVQQVLRTMAVGGNRVGHPALSMVSRLSPEDLDAALREAVSAGVVRVDGDGYAFRHALVREAVVGDLLPGERSRLHVGYAEVLQAHPEYVPESAAEVAHHWYSAHDNERAFAAYLRAADDAERRYAFREAQQAGERALELWDRIADPRASAGGDRVDLLHRTAWWATDAGENERALALVTVALEESSPEREPERFAGLLRTKAKLLEWLGRPGGTELLQRALALLPAGPPSELRAELLERLAGNRMLRADFREAAGVASEVVAMAESLGSTTLLAGALNVLGTSRTNLGEYEQGLRDLVRSRELAAGLPRILMRGYLNQADVLSLLGRYDEAIRLAEAGVERAHEFGLARTSGAMLAGNAAEPLIAVGEWERAERFIMRALDLKPAFNHEMHIRRLRCWLLLWRGRLEEADQELRVLRERVTGRMDEPQILRPLSQLTAEAALAAGDPASAWAELRGALFGERYDFPGHDLPLLATAARALAGRIRAARAGLVHGSGEPGSPAPGNAAPGNAAPGNAGPGGTGGSGSGSAGGTGSDGRHGNGSGPTDAARLRAVLERIAPHHPAAHLWRTLFEAELAGVATASDTAPRAGGVPGAGPDPGAGRLAAGAGPGSDPDGWRAATAAAATAGPAHLRAYTSYRLAEALVVAGDRPGAEEALRAAAEQAASLGAGLIRSWIDDLGRRARLGAAAGTGQGGRLGATPARAEALTARELQVLRLVGEGRSNRQIGEVLFISAKTASVHVSNILAKLGASTRAEAAFIASRDGLLGGGAESPAAS